MGSQNDQRCVFSLTSLQIGDLQSYLSHLSLFLAPASKRLYILVDNRPWLKEVRQPAHLWQLMVNKSRLSPFANSRARKGRKGPKELFELKATSESNVTRSRKLKQWFPVIDATMLSQKRALLPVEKLRTSLVLNSGLHRILSGLIVFEVAWADVRGINYLNELQTDTSLALEAKFMRRWEFDNIAQAAGCTPSWFSGTQCEQVALKEHLESLLGEEYYDAQEDFPSTCNREDETRSNFHMCSEDESPCCPSSSFGIYPVSMEDNASVLDSPESACAPHKRRRVTKSTSFGGDVNTNFEGTPGEIVGPPTCTQTSYVNNHEEVAEATRYRDVLILVRFNDHDLPFKLREIIMPDLRLLTLLEAGLPSWVIFLQSYPGFCHIYRPWMCPLARILYVIISVVTVLIGFYDLYKNVPVLKATASRLCGPLFDWIETWEMISRIRYLGTMLFLHNFKKAVEWFLMITRTIRSFLSVFTKPLAGPFLEFMEFLFPIWDLCIQAGGGFFSVIWTLIEPSFSLVENLMEIVLFPMWFILSVAWNIATFLIYPVFWVLWEVLYVPIRVVLGLSSLVTFLCSCVYDLVGDLWLAVSSTFKLASSAGSTVGRYEVSMWRALWNDLFSQVFRAVRSILYGFVAFFTACNRHRLSIYNHLQEFFRRLSHQTKRSTLIESSHRDQSHRTQNLSAVRHKILHPVQTWKQR